MQVHENHSIKRAGVAGIRARAGHNDRIENLEYNVVTQ
nr:MAG TPA: hypothetical protein [Caudoviricetes sp.]